MDEKQEKVFKKTVKSLVESDILSIYEAKILLQNQYCPDELRLSEMAYSSPLINMMFKPRRYSGDISIDFANDMEFQRILSLIADDWPNMKRVGKWNSFVDEIHHELDIPRVKELYSSLTPEQQDTFWNLVDMVAKIVE